MLMLMLIDSQMVMVMDTWSSILADEAEQKSKGGTNWRPDCEPLLLASFTMQLFK